MSKIEIPEPPVRLCCGQRHYGPVCPDGKVMCCICFERVDIDDLALTEDGKKEDVCKKCGKREGATMRKQIVITVHKSPPCEFDSLEELKRYNETHRECEPAPDWRRVVEEICGAKRPPTNKGKK